MKKTMAFLLTLILIVGLCPAMGMAEEASADLTTIKIMGYERQIADGATFAERQTQQVWQEAERIFAENGFTFEFEIIVEIGRAHV